MTTFVMVSDSRLNVSAYGPFNSREDARKAAQPVRREHDGLDIWYEDEAGLQTYKNRFGFVLTLPAEFLDVGTGTRPMK